MKRSTPLRRERPLRAGRPPAQRTPLRRRTPLARGADAQLRPSALAQTATPIAQRPMAASQAQRAKIIGAACVVCGQTRGITPAHLAARTAGGCDDPACVVPACWVHHRAFDAGRLDLLPYLEPRWRTEIAHAVAHLGLIGAYRRLTGGRLPAGDVDSADTLTRLEPGERPARGAPARRSRSLAAYAVGLRLVHRTGSVWEIERIARPEGADQGFYELRCVAGPSTLGGDVIDVAQQVPGDELDGDDWRTISEHFDD